MAFYGKTALCLFVCISVSAYAVDCYTLKARKQPAGFFSIFNTVVGALDFIDRHDAHMIIDFGTEGFYYDPSVGPNWWSYYFEPICSNISEQSIYKVFKQYQTNTIFSLTGQFILSRERAHYLINKYVHIKPHITAIIDRFVQDYFVGNYVIGIHYRGTDKVREASVVSYEHMRDQVLSIMERVIGKPVSIFVATDDAQFLIYMQQEFEYNVCALDALRSSDNKPVHTQTNVSNYKKGEDALVDCILLSKTDFLIKMASNLSDVSLQFNPQLPFIQVNTGYFE